MSIIQQLNEEIAPYNTNLVAVTKTQPIEKIEELYKQGQRIFGENRVQELLQKYDKLPKDASWHLIGHLQKNKVKYIASFIDMIHAVDSLALLEEINKQAAKHNRVIPCLLQFKVAEEQAKYGFDYEAIKEELLILDFSILKNIKIIGIMGMGTFTSDKNKTRQEFQELKQIFEALKATIFKKESSFNELSMGMSGDYKIAIEEGSTMVRVGSLLFK